MNRLFNTVVASVGLVCGSAGLAKANTLDHTSPSISFSLNTESQNNNRSIESFLAATHIGANKDVDVLFRKVGKVQRIETAENVARNNEKRLNKSGQVVVALSENNYAVVSSMDGEKITSKVYNFDGYVYLDIGSEEFRSLHTASKSSKIDPIESRTGHIQRQNAGRHSLGLNQN